MQQLPKLRQLSRSRYINMNHDDLKEHMDRRFDHLERKIDTFQRRVSTNEADIGWIKGTIKWSAALLTSIITSLIGAVAHLLTR